MAKKFIPGIFLLLLLLAMLPNSLAIYAQSDISGQIQTFGQTVYGQTEPEHPAAIAAVIIQGALGLLGIIFVILVIYGGFLYMTSAGESDKVKKAKNILTTAIIGVIIIFAAYAVTYFVFDVVLKTTTEGGGLGEGPGGG